MKLEIGMYVRTKTKGMGRIISLTWCDDDECCFIEIAKNHRTGIKYNNIKKASYNIIDLIEEGDYINGRYVDKYNDKLVVFSELPNHKWTVIDLDNEHYYIASVITREQFKYMEYHIGE